MTITSCKGTICHLRDINQKEAIAPSIAMHVNNIPDTWNLEELEEWLEKQLDTIMIFICGKMHGMDSLVSLCAKHQAEIRGVVQQFIMEGNSQIEEGKALSNSIILTEIAL